MANYRKDTTGAMRAAITPGHEGAMLSLLDHSRL